MGVLSVLYKVRLSYHLKLISALASSGFTIISLGIIYNKIALSVVVCGFTNMAAVVIYHLNGPTTKWRLSWLHLKAVNTVYILVVSTIQSDPP